MQPQASTSSPDAKSHDPGALLGDFVSPEQAQLAGDELADELQSIIDESRAISSGEANPPPACADKHSNAAPGGAAAIHPAAKDAVAPPLADGDYSFEPPSAVTDSAANKPAASQADPSAISQENVVPSSALPKSSSSGPAEPGSAVRSPGKVPSRPSSSAPVAPAAADFDALSLEASFATPDEVAADAVAQTAAHTTDAAAEADLSLDELDRQLRDLTEQTRDLNDGVPSTLRAAASPAPAEAQPASSVKAAAPASGQAVAAQTTPAAQPTPVESLEADELSAELEAIDRQLRDLNGEVEQAIQPIATPGAAAAAPPAQPIVPSEQANEHDLTGSFEDPQTTLNATAMPPMPAPAAPAANAATADSASDVAFAGSFEDPETALNAAAAANHSAGSAPATVAAAQNAAAAASGKSAAASAGTDSLKQIDEFLAGHADHAVSGDFETAHDVMAADQATAQAPADAPKPAAPAPASAVASVAVAAASPAPAPTAGPSTPAAPAAPALSSGPAQTTGAAGGKSTKLKLAAWMRKAAAAGIHAAGAVAYRSCALLNAPLTKSSDQTRKTIGYAGLVTALNGTVLLLIKFISSMKS